MIKASIGSYGVQEITLVLRMISIDAFLKSVLEDIEYMRQQTVGFLGQRFGSVF